VLAAQKMLEEYGVAADVWSVTSYQELYRDGHACDRWNMLHPGETPKVPYVTQCLGEAPGVLVAASDYLKVLPDGIDRWTPRRVRSLGTDGFGRSEDRASLRDFFEVDAASSCWPRSPSWPRTVTWTGPCSRTPSRTSVSIRTRRLRPRADRPLARWTPVAGH
jgi:hypothetical protein